MSRSESRTFLVSGVCCSTEEGVLRKALDSLLGAGTYGFNSVTCELRVDSSWDESRIIGVLRKAGFNGRRKNEGSPGPPSESRNWEAVATVVAALLTVFGMILGSPLAKMLFACAMIAGGWRVVRRAWGALRTGSWDMNVLMTVAAIGAVAIGKWEEAAAVVTLFAVSLVLESYSSERSRRALHSLLSMTPETALVMREGIGVDTPTTEIHEGELILVKPGSRVPLDGCVTDGTSRVDESAVTGESERVFKTAGAEVFAGTLNGNGALQVRVTRVAVDSTIARITALVEEAQSRRAPVQQQVDRFARVYTPAVLALAFLVATIPPVLFDAPAIEWLYRALVLLVIACPCALVISTPVALVSAMTSAAKRGVLIKGGMHVENLAQISLIAMDKTGTLTKGSPRVTDVVSLDSVSSAELLHIVAAIERQSEHHLADAAVLAAGEDSGGEGMEKVEDFETIPGRGVRGRLKGISYYLGSKLLAESEGHYPPSVNAEVMHLEGEGKTVVILGRESGPIGLIAFRDTIRHHARQAVEEVRWAGVRRVVMLSGDSSAATRAIAGDLGITDIAFGLMPQDKASYIDRLEREEGKVAMVGDGINDTPALASATVGIAMGVAGSDAALECADVVLMSDNIERLPYLLGLSRFTLRVIRQNILLALGVKVIFLSLAFAGVATLWMAVLADDGAALLVIVNALRTLRYSFPSEHSHVLLPEAG